MPIYEYACDACQTTFEALQKFSDDPLAACEACGAPDPRKLVSAAAFHLKGDGWYVTDYARKGGRKAADKASEPAATDAAPKDSSATDKGGGGEASAATPSTGGGSDGVESSSAAKGSGSD